MGNIDAKRDWGHAKDYVEMQWLMLQQEQPKDYVIATGVQYSVRDFINIAKELGTDIKQLVKVLMKWVVWMAKMLFLLMKILSYRS